MGVIRWWNAGRYERECAEEDEWHTADLGEPLIDWWRRRHGITAITEGGLEIRVKLHLQFPMHVGVAYL